MKTVLVTGATGSQGNAVARHLLKRGFTVRALTRNPANEKAVKLAEKGAIIVKGDLEKEDELAHAMRGCDAVFSMQNFWEKGVGLEGEQRQAINAISAARKEGISHFVQSSIAGAESATGIYHIESKKHIEDKIRSSGLTYTFLRTVFFMDTVIDPRFGKNFIPMICGVLDKYVKGHYIAMDDLGGVAAEIFAQPESFKNTAVNLTSDIVSGEEMKAIIEEITGKDKYRYKIYPWLLWVLSKQFYKQMQWNKSRPWKFSTDETRQVYPYLTSFRSFVEKNKERF